MKPSGISGIILSRSVEFLVEWENGNMTLDDCLDILRSENCPERSAMASLLFEYFRHKGFIDGLIAENAKKGKVRQEMRLLLCCAVTQLLFQTGLARQSAVNIAVDYAKYLNGPGGGGFVNAMLRGILRDPVSQKQNIQPSFPDLLRKRWTTRFGKEEAEKAISFFASNPPVSFRVRKDVPAETLAQINAITVDGLDFTGKFRFMETDSAASLFDSRLTENASVYVQDPATSLVFSLIDEPLTGRILDACAAPGGKTVMISDLTDPAKVTLFATDRSARRLIPLNQNLRHAGVRCRTSAADACELPFTPHSFDCVLADVPCSNTGVIRRRPDAPWRFTEKNLQELTDLQAKILDSLSNLIAPGGILLYSTCSVEEEEDEQQISSFVTRHPDFVMEKQRLLLPSQHHDGAFAAMLRKK